MSIRLLLSNLCLRVFLEFLTKRRQIGVKSGNEGLVVVLIGGTEVISKIINAVGYHFEEVARGENAEFILFLVGEARGAQARFKHSRVIIIGFNINILKGCLQVGVTTTEIIQ